MSDIGCIHTQWVCFFERAQDSAIQAFCQRCKAISPWRPNRADAERSLSQPSVGDVRPSGTSAEIFTR